MKLLSILACLVLGLVSSIMAASMSDMWIHSLATEQGMEMKTVTEEVRKCAGADKCGDIDEDAVTSCLNGLASRLCPNCDEEKLGWLLGAGWFQVLNQRECSQACNNIICSNSLAWWFCGGEDKEEGCEECRRYLMDGGDSERRSFGRRGVDPPKSNPPKLPKSLTGNKRSMQKTDLRNLLDELKSKLANFKK